MAGGFEVGRIFAKVGFEVDETGKTRFDRAYDQAKAKADKPIVAEAKVDADTAGAARFEAAVEALRAQPDVKVEAKVDVDELGAGRFIDAMGRMREANGRFVKGASDGLKEVGDEVEKTGRKTEQNRKKLDLSGLFTGLGRAASILPRPLEAVARGLLGMAEAGSKVGTALGGSGGSGAGSILGLIGGLSGGLAGLVVVAGLAGAVFVSLAGAATALVASMAAALAGATALAVGLGAAFGPFLALGIAVVARVAAMTEAYKAVSAASDKSGQTAKQAAARHASAANAIKSAEQALADARRNGDQAVADARRALDDARVNGAQAVADAESKLADVRERSAADVARAEQDVVDARRNGLREVQDAQEAYDDARISGAQDVARAEQDLADAQADVTRAQTALTQARANERREVEDLAKAVRRTALTEEGAQLTLREALKRLREVQNDPKATRLDVDEAQHAVKEARAGVDDARTATKRANEDAAAGATKVKDAQAQLTAARVAAAKAEQQVATTRRESNIAVERAELALSKARQTAARDNEDARRQERATIAAGAKASAQAQRDVGQAAKDAAETTRRAAEQVARARADEARSVARAEDAIAQARESAAAGAEQAGAAAETAQQKLAKLSDTERRLIGTVRNFAGAITKAIGPATDAILSGVDDALKAVTPLLEHVGGQFDDLGERIGGIIRKAARSLAGPEWRDALDGFLETSRAIVEPLADGFGSLLEIVRNTATAAQPFVKDLAKGFRDSFGGLADKTDDASRMSNVIGGLVDHLKSWAHFAGAVVRLMYVIFNGGAKDGKSLLDTITHIVNRWADFLGTEEGQRKMRQFFHDSVEVTKKFVGQVVELVAGFLDFSIKVQHLLATVKGLGKPFEEWGHRAHVAIELVVGALKILIGLLTLDFGMVWSGLKDVAKAGVEGVKILLLAQTAGMRKIARALWGVIPDAASAAWDIVRDVAKGALDAYLGGMTTILGIVEKVVDTASHLPFVGGKFKGVADSIDGARKSIDDYRESLRKTDEQHAKTANIKRLNGQVSDLRDELRKTKKGTDDYRDTAEKLRKKQRELNTAMGDTEDKGRKGAKGVKAIGSSADTAAGAVGDAAVTIADQMNDLLGQLGDKKRVVIHSRKPTSVPGGDDPRGVFKAGGGWIGQPGQRGGDDQLAFLGLGEAVVNGPQQDDLDDALAFRHMLTGRGTPSLNMMFSARTWMPHHAAFAKGGRIPGHATGRRSIVPVPGFPGELANAAVVPKIENIAHRFHLTLTDAYGPGHGHKSPGHNVTGTAADFAGPDAAMDRAVRYLVAQGYLVGYDGRFGSQAWPGHGPSYVAGSNAHLHVELGGKGGTISDLAATIAGARTTGPQGALRSLVAGASSTMRSAANRSLGQVGVSGQDNPGRAGRGRYSFDQLRALWIRAGGAPSMASLMAHVALAESGGDPNARNASGATGLWQILGSMLPGDLTNPLVNARNAVAKLSAQGLGAWAASRGSWGRFAGRFAGGRRGARASRTRTIPHFAGSAQPTTGGAGSTPSLASLRHTQTDRIDDYDNWMAAAERDQSDYSYWDRKFSLSDEELIDPETGEVNADQVKARASELLRLSVIATKRKGDLERGREVARRVVQTYRKILTQLRRARAAVRGNKTFRNNRKAYYNGQISTYSTRLGEWVQKVGDLRDPIRDAGLDVDDIKKEYDAVVHTAPQGGGGDTGGDAPDPPADPSDSSNDPSTAGDDATGQDASQDAAAIAAQAQAQASALAATVATQEQALRTLGGAGDFGPGGRNALAAAGGGNLPASLEGVGGLGDVLGNPAGPGRGLVVVQQFHMMAPPKDPKTLQDLGAAAVAGMDYNEPRSSPRVDTGL